MLRFFRFSPIITVLLLAFLTTQVRAADHVIAIPQSVMRDQARMIHTAVTDIVMGADPGDIIRVIDATAGETIAVFTIPEDGRADVPNLRRRALADPLNAFNRFVREHYIDIPETAPADAGAILLPQLLDHVAQAYGHATPADRAVCMLVIGSARYRDPREPGFDMSDGRFPSDGLILGASQTQSPYGVLDRQDHLRGVYINMLTLDTDLPSDVYALRIWRAWHLHIHARGGILATYTNDPNVVLQRFSTCERTPTRGFSTDTTRAISSMITIERIPHYLDGVEATPIQPYEAADIETEADLVPDAVGRFGQVVRLERVAFHASAGLITFDEVPLGSRNPIYTGSMHGNDLPDMVVRFGGYFVGQRLGASHECPEGANPDGCVLERPDGPLALESASPPTVVEQDGSNPESPALSGTPVFNGPVAIWFSQDVAAVGLVGGYFNGHGSTAIQAYARDGSLIGGVVNLSVGMEFLALATEDGTPRIAGIQFSLVGNEPAGYAVDTIRFALPGQYDEAEHR